MGEYSADEVAARAGVKRSHVDRLVELGILAADESGHFSSGHVRRASITHSLEQAGLPLPGIAEAIRRGVLGLDFVDQPTYDRYDALGNVTFRELSTQTGVPVDLLLIIRETLIAPGTHLSGCVPSVAQPGPGRLLVWPGGGTSLPHGSEESGRIGRSRAEVITRSIRIDRNP